jgi:hypothetical protein
LHVIGPSERSIREVAETAVTIGGSAKHYIIKNHVSADGGFAEWEKDVRFAAELKARESVTVDIPHLNADATDALQKIGGSFAAFTRDASQSRMLRGYVRTWLDEVFAGFERVGLGELISAAIG